MEQVVKWEGIEWGLLSQDLNKGLPATSNDGDTTGVAERSQEGQRITNIKALEVA